MSRNQAGQVVEREWKAGRGYALRFLAYGQRRYLTLGLQTDGWTRARAEEELSNVLADVRRGLWIAPDRNTTTSSAGVPQGSPTFHVFASDWLASRQGEVSQRMIEHQQWALSYHLLPYFAHHHLDEITIETVDAYRRHKVQQSEQRRTAIENGDPALNRGGQPLRPLSPVTINKTIDVLQAILATALEYGHIPSNPATGRRRRLKPAARRPVHLDTVDQIQALLDAAAELDHETRRPTTDRHAIIATLLFAGPRAHELCGLLWRDVDLVNGRLHVRESKTQAGLREIELRPLLHQILTAHKTASPYTQPDQPVFPTGTGGQRDKDNLRNRILAPAIARADELLHQRGHTPLPAGVTPHKLRHTYASILVACGEDPASLMAHLGHTDPKFTLRVYTHLMRRDPAERARLKALVDGTVVEDDALDPIAEAA